MTTDNKTHSAVWAEQESAKEMQGFYKTLADVQPGGRVRLGDALPPLPPMGYEERGTSMGPHDVYYTPVAYTAEQMRDYARAALSAQPSPGGQDALVEEALEYFERAGDAGDRKYVAAIRSALAISQQSGADGLPMVMVSHEFKAQAEYDAEITSAVANLLRGNQLGISGSQPEMVSALMRIASSPASAIEALSESEKDVALAQAVEFAEYVERQAKGAMVDAAKRFLSLPYAQELAKRLTPPEGYVLVPVEPTEEMLDAGRAAVMAEHCAGPKWTPRQHFEASGRSTAGIPEDVLDERGPLTKESTAAMVFGAMLAARPEVKP